MIRIGVINIDVSHPKAFSAYLEKQGRAKYVAVYNDGFRGDDEVEGFIRSAGLEKRCDTVEELAAMVDVGFIQGCNWDRHLDYVEPFFKLGKPVFIDKPIVGKLSDIEKLRDYVRRGAVILGSSSVRYAYEIGEFLALPVEERGEIISVFGTNGVDEFNYGVHIVEALGGLLGPGAESCRYIGAAQRDGIRTETFTVAYDGGVRATYTLCHGRWQPFTLTVMTTKTTYQIKIDTARIYGAMLDRICDYMENGDRRTADVEELAESILVMLAGRLSRERDGCEICLKDIPADDPGYDGALFEKGYAAASAKIYLA